MALYGVDFGYYVHLMSYLKAVAPFLDFLINEATEHVSSPLIAI